MDDPDAATARADLISAMFALLLIKYEDAAHIAANCQEQTAADDLLARSLTLISLTEETLTLAKATCELVTHPVPKPTRSAQ